MSDNLPVVENDMEFVPLPYYSWEERPESLPLSIDEAATAIHLAKGDEVKAASLVKVDVRRLQRLIRAVPRLRRIYEEALGVTLAKAASVPIQTLWDPSADARRLEWASTKLLQSKIAKDHPLSPAPPSSLTALSNPANTGTLILKWGEPPAIDGRGGDDVGSTD